MPARKKPVRNLNTIKVEILWLIITIAKFDSAARTALRKKTLVGENLSAMPRTA